MQKLKTTEEVEKVFQAGEAIILKHSSQCPISRFVHREVASFVARRPEIPVYVVDVLEDRTVSDYLEDKTGIRHQSPQAFLVENGRVKWHESHYRIDAKALLKQFGGDGADSPAETRRRGE